jgi:hypothetical protein
MHDRFVVRSTTGYKIKPSTGLYTAGSKQAPTSYYVLDRGYSYRVVYAVDGQNHGNRFKKITDADRQAMAEAKADKLNAWAMTA